MRDAANAYAKVATDRHRRLQQNTTPACEYRSTPIGSAVLSGLHTAPPSSEDAGERHPEGVVKYSLDFILNTSPSSPSSPSSSSSSSPASRRPDTGTPPGLSNLVSAARAVSSSPFRPPSETASQRCPPQMDSPYSRRQSKRRAARSNPEDPSTATSTSSIQKKPNPRAPPTQPTSSSKPPSTATATKAMMYEEKRLARKCTIEDCFNYTINKGLCFRHGGGKKCSMNDCNASAKVGGLCWKHGGTVQCSVKDCDRRGKSRGLCWAHGGGTKCQGDGCSKVAVSNGFCWAHGGGKRCLYDGCQRPAYERTLNYCPKHFNRFEKGEEVLEV